MRGSGSRASTRRFLRILGALLLLAQARSSLYAQAGALLSSPEAALLTVYVNERRYADEPVTVDGENVSLPGPFVGAALLPLLIPAVSEAVRRVSRVDGSLETSSLSFLEFGVEFDQSALSLRIRVPPRFMAVRLVGPGSAPAPENLRRIDPSFFSAYLNSSLRVVQAASEYEDPYAVVSETLDGAVRAGSWVAEAAVDLESSRIGSGAEPEAAPTLDYARAVRDFRGPSARLSAGTVDLPWKSFLSRVEALGATFVRDTSVGSGPARRESRRALTDTFSVEEPARVSVSLNGSTVFSTRLEAGRYRFSDLPYTSGVNEVEVTIEETNREPRTFRVGVPFDSAALRGGEFDFGFGAGVDEASRKEPVSSGYLAYGLLDTLTAGLSAETGFGSFLGGLGASVAAPWGLFGLSLGLAATGGGNRGYAAEGTYRLILPNRRSLPRLSLRFLWESADFAPPLPSEAGLQSGAERWTLAAQASQTLPHGFSLSAAAEHGADGVVRGDRDSYLSLALSAPLGQGATLQSTAAFDDRDEVLRTSLSLAVLIVPQGGGSTASFRQELTSGEASADVSGTRGKGVGALSYSVGVDNPAGPLDRPSSGAAEVRRTGSAVDLSAAVAYADERRGNGKSAAATFGADAALVFADGTFALSRRIVDSTVILAPDASFSGADVELRLGSERTVVGAGDRPAVAGQLAAYRDAIAEIDTPGSPADVAASEGRVLLAPAYRSVLMVRPTKATSAYVRGRIADSAGAPVAWMTGIVLDSGGAAVGETFSDEDGRFELYDLPSGGYTLEWADPSLPRVRFEIPPGADGAVDLGALAPREGVAHD
jgi:outer membrane usher protein FimD/PapC